MDVGCAYCDSLSGVLYRWTCPGCRARMLATLPTREMRSAYVQRWRAMGETEMADAVIAKLREMAVADNSNR